MCAASAHHNYWRVPTSTIQILVFCVVGVGLAGHISIQWGTIGKLAIVWVCAPIVAFGLGFLFTRLLDLLVPPELAQSQVKRLSSTAAEQGATTTWLARAFPGVVFAWQAVPGEEARLTRLTHLFSLMMAGLLGGVAMAVQRRQIIGILRGWLIGPLSGLGLAFVLEWLLRLLLH
jgi:PiT family inorganic phosphate transporter